MEKYNVTIKENDRVLSVEEDIDAYSEEQAIETAKEWYTDDPANDLAGRSLVFEVQAICPHDSTPLVSRMIDVDGTNLEEHQVCEECGYGYPALR